MHGFRISEADGKISLVHIMRALLHHERCDPVSRRASRRFPSRSQVMHTRIRKFNTKDTYPEQKLDNDLCQAVVAKGSTVFVRGQVGQDLDTAVNVGVGDPVAQTEQAMANIEQLLTEAGGRLEHICKVTIYLTDPRFREPVYRTIGKWLKGVYPVSTGIVVAGLARPEWLVEVDVIAVIP
jgi:enamine deaminase RidA (YjgF/YER057c/UK114 family)